MDISIAISPVELSKYPTSLVMFKEYSLQGVIPYVNIFHNLLCSDLWSHT